MESGTSSDGGDAAAAALVECLRGDLSPEREREAMDAFLLENAQRYDFSDMPAQEDFVEIFRLLIKQRFLPDTSRQQPRDCQLRVLQCMRVLMRDPAHRMLFSELGGAQVLVRLFVELTDEHSSQPHTDFASGMLVETLSIMKRFASLEELAPLSRTAAAASTSAAEPTDDMRLQRALVALLSTREVLVLQCVLVAMHQFVQLDSHLQVIGQLGCAEMLLRILTDYEPTFKAHAAELIELLLSERTFLLDVVLHDGTAAILSALPSDDPNVQLPLLRTLERMIGHGECGKEIRQIGGINVLINVLSAPNLAPRVAIAICSVLTAIALDDEGALQIRKANGVYQLGHVLLQCAPPEAANIGAPTTAGSGRAAAVSCASADARISPSTAAAAPAADTADVSRIAEGGEPSPELLAAHAFRALRILFSTERNRKIFQRLFPPVLFAAFIDLGHYVNSLACYAPLAQQLFRLTAEMRVRMQEALADINVIKGSASHKVKDYAVQELLGRGAFGSVYQVKKDTGETLFAMKELPLDAVAEMQPQQPSGAQQPVSYLKREVKILSTLQHPNIIRYYESFQQGKSLYIVMELVEGATLLDHLNSLAEKGQTMPEARIWSIFTQMCLALRYIHKEKHVVHRDLTPSNVMITAEGVVKLADFGLAKQRMGTNSVMDSVVGTVLYQCPEIIQHETYGEKADIWSLGCILYQTAMLHPPFEGSNPLVVATNIVEGNYKPIRGPFEPLLVDVVSKLLSVDPQVRPDIDAVSSLISPVLMAELARVSRAEHQLRAEVHIERDFRQRHEREASRNKEAVHRLLARHHLGSGQPRGASHGPGHGGGPSGGVPYREPGEPSLLRRSGQTRSPMLSISPSRIREIHDPCSRLLNQLHKILFICELPPSMEGELSAERLAIEKYKRELFSHRNHHRGRNLKVELHKVVSGSQETIDLAFRSSAADVQRISYEAMQQYIEQVLDVTGYYALGATSEEPLGSEPPPPKMQRAISLPGSLPEPARLVPMPDRGVAIAGSAPAPDPAPVYPPGRFRTTPGPVKLLMRAPNTPAGATLPPVIRAGGANLPPVPPPSTT